MASRSTFLCGLLLASLAGAASPTQPDHPDQSSSRPPAFYLAGDSTTAPQSSGGGGWGAGFLALLKGGATGKNFGRNGATTKSFMQQAWPQVLSSTAQAKGRYTAFVTIQFGHNDQKKDRGISDSQFSANLRRMASDVVAKGGTPILVTPLIRRSFSGSAPAENLARQRELVLSAAKAGGFRVIDLNSASRKYVAAIGKSAAEKYNLKGGDNTHLNAHGSKVFGRMVADLIVEVVPDLKPYFREEATLTAAIRNGRPG